MNPSQNDIIILMVVAPLFASIIVPIVGWRAKKLCYPLTILAVLISLFSSLITVKTVLNHGPVQYYLGGWKPPWGIEFYIDHLSRRHIFKKERRE
jgi:multicomponent Na+:H+ antiporter subunit D